MTAFPMIMALAFSQLPPDTDLVDQARSQLGTGSVSVADYVELVRSEKTVPQLRLQEWLVIRGFYAWALAVRKPTKEQESRALEEARECLKKAKGMGPIDIRQVCPGECWEFVPAAAKVYWNELPGIGPKASQPAGPSDEFPNRGQPVTRKAEAAEQRLREIETRRRQVDTELRALSQLLAEKQKLLSKLDARLKARQQELTAKQEEIDRLSAVLLKLEERIAGVTATRQPAATRPAGQRMSATLTR